MRAAKGLTCVGVVPVVVNFNIRMTIPSSRDKGAVSQITALLRVPDAVEALTLRRGEQLEVACNLRSPSLAEEHGRAALLAKATALARDRGLSIESSYTTGPSENELLDMLYGY